MKCLFFSLNFLKTNKTCFAPNMEIIDFEDGKLAKIIISASIEFICKLWWLLAVSRIKLKKLLVYLDVNGPISQCKVFASFCRCCPFTYNIFTLVSI